MATYYVDATTGDDNDTGLTEALAWQTISKVNGESFNAGDIINFKKAEVWREQLTVPSSGSSGSPITFGAYGSGADPIINGSDLITGWTEATGAWTEIWNAEEQTGDSSWGDTSSSSGQNNRIWLKNASISQNASTIRIKFKAHSSQNTVIDNCAIGEKGDGVDEDVFDYETGETPSNIQQGSSDTFTITAGTSEYSDQLSHSIDSSKDYLIAWQIAGGSTYYFAQLDYGSGPYNRYIRYSGTDETENTNVSSYSGNRNLTTIEALEGYISPPNVWQATCNTEPNWVFFDGTLGNKQTSIGAVDSANDWHWESNVLYVYYTEDPDGAVDIEACSRNRTIDINEKTYITIDGIHFTKANSSSLLIDGVAANITIQNCEGSYNANPAITFSGNTGASTLIDSCHLHHNRTDGIYQNNENTTPGSGTEVIISNNEINNNGQNGIFCRSQYWIIENNDIHNNGTDSQVGQAIQIINQYDTPDTASIGNNNIIRYNIIYNQSNSGAAGDGNGIILDHWCDSNQVYYNICYNNDGHGIVIYGGASNEVYNNVCYGNSQESNRTVKSEIALKADSAFDRADSNLIKNNIGYTTVANSYAIYVDSYAAGQSNNVIDSNEWYRASGDWWYYDSGGGDVLATWNGQAQVGTDINSDPLFTDPASANFTLQSTSPCIDVGTDVSLTQDYAGNPVPSGGGVDIGAYELQQSGALFFGAEI